MMQCLINIEVAEGVISAFELNNKQSGVLFRMILDYYRIRRACIDYQGKRTKDIKVQRAFECLKSGFDEVIDNYQSKY